MEEVVSLFDALMMSFLESFSQDIDQTFSSFENCVASGQYNDSQLDTKLQNILSDFPSSNSKYKDIVATLTSFAASNPVVVLSSLCVRFKNELNRSSDQPPTTLTITSLSFKATNFHHFQFLRYLTLIILTDLILSIFKDFPNKQPIQKMVPCGYSLCMQEHRLHRLQMKLLGSWSDIFRLISFQCLNEISLSFEQYSDDNSTGRIYTLVSKVKATPQFVDSLLFSLQQSRKHKLLTSEMLSAISILLASVQCGGDILDEFYNIAWTARNTSNLKDGAIDLICVLLNRIPAHQKKAGQFYTSRVFKHAGEDSKVERSARAFLKLIRGDISKLDQDKDPYFLGSAGAQGSDSFASVFMKVFFAKSNFAKCINIFGEILAHLASIDISAFEKQILPSFVKSNSDVAKFNALMKALDIINSPSFLKSSVCSAKKTSIASINEAIRPEYLKMFNKQNDLANDKYLVLTRDVLQLQSTLDESDHIVLEFLNQNNYLNFDTITIPTKFKDSQKDVTQLQAILRVLPYVVDHETYRKSTIPELLIKYMCHSNFIISSVAHEVYVKVIQDAKVQAIFAERCVSLLLKSTNEVTAKCLSLLLGAIHNSTFPEKLYPDLEATVFCCYINDLPYCRTLALRILKHMSAVNIGTIYKILHENTSTISEAVNRSILVLNVPSKPSLIKPPLGYLDFEHACCSRYNDLWLIFLSEIYNILIEMNCRNLLTKCQTLVQPLSDRSLSSFTTAAVHLLYTDSFAFDMMNEEEEEEGEDEGETVEKKKGSHLGAEALFEKILALDKIEPKQILIHSFCFLNWRVIPSVLPFILSIDNELYPNAAASLSFIIQNPENFNHIISSIFRRFIEFLSLLQSYFIHLQINSAREINWDEEHIALLRQHQDVCVNYCILISAAFNNIQDQIPEDEWPLSYRQVLVQFLIHWAQLPSEFDKIQAYAINALIPIIHAGTVFTDGFSFELPMLEMMVQCQLSGYPVLDSLLLFHLDILLDEFVKNSFLRPKRESQLFLEAIMGALEYCEDASVLQTHVGSLVLLALYVSQERIDAAQRIMVKVASLFLDKAHEDRNPEEEQEEDLNIESVVQKFQFATEQVIDSGFEIIRNSTKITVSKTIVTILSYFFDKIRLLPTHSFIVQGVPSKFRKFTVMSFFDSMYSVSSSLCDELHDVFSSLWYDLLRSTDNNVVVLLCLFESSSSDIKEKIFTQLLEKEPALISKYLAKRCTFAYWYFLRTQRQLGVSSVSWMLSVLTRGFIDFVDYSAPNYTTTFHFSLLFIEEAGELFEALIAVFGLEVVDSCFIWTKDGANGTIHAASIVGEIVAILSEQKQEAIEKWSLEAIRWAVACCDIKIGYRSLVIFNALQTTLPQPYIPLLAKAVLYHLSRVSEDDCEDVALFVGEVFDVLQRDVDDQEVASFAFRFASLFLNCPAFERGTSSSSSCLQRAMPIFLACTQQAVLSKGAQEVLADAFVPFLRNIENDDQSQQLLGQITEISDTPELLLVAACFLLKPLPFIPMQKTYKEIISAPISALDATKTLRLFSRLIKTASRPLVDSIIELSTELVRKFEKAIDRQCLVPIYTVALQKVANMKSAVNFMNVLLKVDPGISMLSNDIVEGHKFIDEIKKGLAQLVDKSSEVVPITNCKQISQLNGMIDQQAPPKILPFSSQYEMFVGLRKDVGKEKRSGSGRSKRWSSSLSLTSGILSNRSMIIPTNIDQTDFSNLKLEEIPKSPILMKLLDIPTDETGSWQFVVSAKEFLDLEE